MAGKRLERIAKTTGTTVGEARGIMKNVRQSVAAGDKKTARKTLTQALKGGPAAGVKKSPARTAKARATSKKVVRKIAKRQAATAPGGFPKPRGRANAITRGKGKKTGLRKQGY